MTDKKTSTQNFLRTTALIVALVGAVGSLYFMFSASRKQNSIILLGLFTAWVLSPFIGLFISSKISKRWTVTTRSLLYWLIIVLTIGSLVAYSGAFNTPQTKNAFIFLIVPLISWILLIVAVLTARRLSRKTNLNSSNSNINL
ncbi:MAG: hypothetical protein ABIO55_09040 [Ginsengibacter sp.]